MIQKYNKLIKIWENNGPNYALMTEIIAIQTILMQN